MKIVQPHGKIEDRYCARRDVEHSLTLFGRADDAASPALRFSDGDPLAGFADDGRWAVSQEAERGARFIGLGVGQ